MLTVVFGIGLLAPSSTYAVSAIADQCKNNAESAICKDQSADPNAIIKVVINTLLFIVGAIAVVMIIIGGIIYVTSAGDSGKVTQGKNTVLYAVIGLVVALLAFGIVNWVLGRFK